MNINMNMLTFAINVDSKTFIYQQLYSFIKSEIQSGSISFNTRLPSKRKLSEYLQISQNTIQTAYDQLIEEGYIVSIERKGFFVNKIDNLIQLKNIGSYQNNKSPFPANTNNTKKSKIFYDFSYHGIDMESFPFKTWRKLTNDVINKYDKEILQLGDSQGHKLLRASIAAYLYQSRGVKCSADQIIISAGTEFLFQILFQLFDRASIYGVENPGYEKLNLLFSSNQTNFKPIDIDEKGMTLEAIIKSKANILCITPAHQFPSGEIMPISRRVQHLSWANKGNDRYIIEDDYDSEFKYSGKPIPALQGLDCNEKIIYMGNFSKSLSPSIRVSYMVLPVHLVKKYLSKLSFLNCPVPIIDQKVLFRFIQEGYFERHLNRMRNIYKKKREILVNGIKNLKCKVEVLGADTGLHLLLKVDNKMTEDQLVSSALVKGVKVYGVSKYYLDDSYNKKLPRILIGFATMKESEIGKAISLLKKAWF